MPIRYFKKHNGNVKLWMFGRPIQFHLLGTNGFIRSDDPLIRDDAKIMAEIDRGIRDEQGGVTELSESQYEDLYVKKKLSPPSPVSKRAWREELGFGQTQDTLGQRLVSAVEPKAPTPPPPQEATQSNQSLRAKVNLGKM